MNDNLKTFSVLGIGALTTIGITNTLPDSYNITQVEENRIVKESSCNGENRYFIQKKDGVIIGSTSNNCTLDYMQKIDYQYDVEEISFSEYEKLITEQLNENQ